MASFSDTAEARAKRAQSPTRFACLIQGVQNLVSPSSGESPRPSMQLVPPSPEDKPISGTTVARAPENADSAELNHCWSSCPAEEFNVRAAGYKATSRKESSLAEFYELAAFDFIKSSVVVEHIAQFMALRNLPRGGEHEVFPPVFVVNCQLPDAEPSMFSSPEDGPGRSAVFYFVLKADTVAAIKNGTGSAGAKLLQEYFKRAPSDPDFRGRFKVIAMVKNLEALELPGFISNYNGKPVLITRSGSLFQGDGYMEMDIRVHRFSYLARKGLNLLQGKFADMILDVGFLIEGREEAELPEQLLGGARFYRLDYAAATQLFKETEATAA